MNGQAYYDVTQESFILKFPFSLVIKADLKATFQDKYFWNATRREWAIHRSHHDKIEDFCLRHSIRLLDSAKRVIMKLSEVRKEVISLPNLDIEIPLKHKLFPYQAKGVAFNIRQKKTLIGDVMGLGKTIQAMASVVALDAWPCLIIAPPHLMINWVEEWQKWTNWRASILNNQVKRSASKLLPAGLLKVVVINYQSLPKYFLKDRKEDEITINSLAGYFKSVIVDESHWIKNKKTTRFKMVREITRSKDVKFLLSGTPIENKISDLIAQIEVLDQMHHFGGVGGFQRNYLNIERKWHGDQEDPKYNELHDLQQKMRTHFYYRREKHEVLEELPDKFRQVVKVDITNLPEYREQLLKFKAFMKSSEADDAALVLTEINKLRQISAMGKLESLQSMIEDCKEENEKLVVFCHHRMVVEAIMDANPGAVKVVGGMKAEEKDASVKRFQNDKDCYLIVCSIEAASTGLTLTASSNIVMFEHPWNASKSDQCEDRTHRIGQKNSVTAYMFVGAGTVDEYMVDVIENKRQLASAATGAVEKVNVMNSSILGDVLQKFKNS